MQANDLNLTQFLELQDHHFVIPVYQRNYDWGIDQCDQLLSDILQLGKSNQNDSHFIGSILRRSGPF